jgi:hypothetical protein
MLAEGAQQAHKPIAAAQELLSGWLQAGQSADPEALRRLAGMLSECYESCLSALSLQENSCNARSACQSLASRSTAFVPSSAPASSINGLRFGTLNVRGKLGSNVQEVLSHLNNVKLDVLCIQESLHAIVDVPDYIWVTPKRSSSLTSAASPSPLRGIGFLVKKELRNLMTVCT